MGVFTDEAEVHKYIGGVFEKGLADPDIGPKLSASGVVLQINYTDPEAIVTVDLPNATVLAGATDITPDVELFMSADTGNRFWQGKVNLSLVMANATDC